MTSILSGLFARLNSKHAFLLIILIAIASGVYYFFFSNKNPFPIPDGQYVLIDNTNNNNKTTAGKIISGLWNAAKQEMVLSENLNITDKTVISTSIMEDKSYPIQVDGTGKCFIHLKIGGELPRTAMLSYNNSDNILEVQLPNETLRYHKR